MFSFNNLKKGFSLFEVLIYISILSIVLLIVINTTLMMVKAYSGMKVSQNINNSAVGVMERLSREIRWANNINEGNSVFGSDGGVLELSSVDDLDNPITTVFSIASGNLEIQQGVIVGILNNSNVTVNKFYLNQIDTGISKMIKIELEIEGEWGDKQKTETFYNSVILREEY